MALINLINPKEAKADTERTHVYLGMKLEVADYEELCGVFGVSATTSPTAMFKQVLVTALNAKGVKVG